MSGRVKPSSKQGKPLARDSRIIDVRRAANLYERFTGHDADAAFKVSIPSLPKVAAVIGELDGVLYSTVRDGVLEKYIHKFAKNDRPLFAVSPDGRCMVIIGGRYQFTERGIVDKSDKSR